MAAKKATRVNQISQANIQNVLQGLGGGQ